MVRGIPPAGEAETKPHVTEVSETSGPGTRGKRRAEATAPTRRSSRLETLNLAQYAFQPPPKRARGQVGAVKLEVEEVAVKEEVEELVEIEPDEKPLRPARPTPKSDRGMPKAARDKAHPEPPRWREQYALIEQMRAKILAPVDTMGCERPRTMQDLDAKTLRFHILISLMLSSQTKDAVTSQAVLNLHETLPGGLTAESLAAAPESTVADAINKVGFWRRKTGYIQDAARQLLLRPGEGAGDVPQTIEELVQLKGVGPKMGFLALQAAWNINAGIGVDVHVHRITNRLKWHKPPTKSPEETRVNLESWLPPEYHRAINPLLVGFGQVVCLPVGPRCDVCLLGQQKLCPSRVAVNAANRKELTFSFTEEVSNGTGGAKVEIGYEGTVESGPSSVGGQVKVESVEQDVKLERVD